MQNGYIERFNRIFRESILDTYLFDDITQVQLLAEEWVNDYNSRRPYEALEGKTPLAYEGIMIRDYINLRLIAIL